MPDIEKEKFAFRRMADHLKAEEGIHITNEEHIAEKNDDSIDYSFEIGDRKIGCEIKRLSPPDNQFEKYASIDKALEQGKKEFRDSGGPALFARFHFGPAAPENTGQAKSVGKKLARIVRAMWDKNMLEISGEDHDMLFEEHGLEGYVSHISICPVGECEPEWIYFPTEWEKSVPTKKVEKIIDCAEKKVSGRRKDYGSVWFLIHNDLCAGFYEPTEEAKQSSYKHSFERIFVVDDFKVYELRGGSENIR